MLYRRVASGVVAALALIGAGNASGQTPAADAAAQPARATTELRRDDLEYRLNYGDVLEFSVRGFPELRQKSMVEIDGEVSLPLAGRVRVIGMPLSAAQSVIKSLTIPRPLQHRFLDGREGFVALSPDDVLITIAEYRPIYVLGDVGKPGELPYRPGMTVRQAIALGGGFDIMRYRLVNPFMESADLKGQHEVLWTEAARVRVRLRRVEVELAGGKELPANVVADIPLDRAYLDQVLRTETETLTKRLEDYAKEVEHIRGLIEQNVAKVDNLKTMLATEMQGMSADSQELEQVKDFQRRGNLPLMRMMEIRRIQLTNSTRVLQTRVQYDQAERDLAEARRSLERLKDNYVAALLAERQEQSSLYTGLLARIAANSEKLEHTSVLKSRLVRGRGGKVNIQIHRSLLDFKQTLVGSEDSPLLPGDTVEIALESERDVNDLLRRSPGARADASAPSTPAAEPAAPGQRPPVTTPQAAPRKGPALPGRP